MALVNMALAERHSLTTRRDSVSAGLRQFLPPSSVLADEESLRPYECDGLSAYRRLPLVVVLPETIEQVQEVVRYCHGHGIPIVARGAGTGLSGGALPIENGVAYTHKKK